MPGSSSSSSKLRPVTSGELRLDAGFHLPDARSRFERALQELQIGLQIARIDVDPDTWFCFDAAYPLFTDAEGAK